MQKNINDTSFDEIDDYMRKQKDSADKKKKQKKNEKKEDKKPHKKGSKTDKYKLDPNATTGPTARCGKCPNAMHSWGHCFLNPKNPKNKLKDKDFMSRHANRNRNQNNQFQNNQQPRQGFATQQMQM